MSPIPLETLTERPLEFAAAHYGFKLPLSAIHDITRNDAIGLWKTNRGRHPRFRIDSESLAPQRGQQLALAYILQNKYKIKKEWKFSKNSNLYHDMESLNFKLEQINQQTKL